MNSNSCSAVNNSTSNNLLTERQRRLQHSRLCRCMTLESIVVIPVARLLLAAQHPLGRWIPRPVTVLAFVVTRSVVRRFVNTFCRTRSTTDRFVLIAFQRGRLVVVVVVFGAARDVAMRGTVAAVWFWAGTARSQADTPVTTRCTRSLCGPVVVEGRQDSAAQSIRSSVLFSNKITDDSIFETVDTRILMVQPTGATG